MCTLLATVFYSHPPESCRSTLDEMIALMVLSYFPPILAFPNSWLFKSPCKDCNFVYYSQTKRSLRTRNKEHIKACKENDLNSMVPLHTNNKTHSLDFQEMSIVDKEKIWH